MHPDKYQLEVIKTKTNILVIAGPGSGKTTTILQKVRYILDSNPDAAILLLSFTNKSVNDIKEKMNDINLDIMTFHKLAIDILNYYHFAYKIADEKLLSYIIDEYFLRMDIPLQNKLCRYLKIIKLNTKTNEYLSLKKLIITFINLFKTNNHCLDHLKKLVKDYKDKYLLKIIFDILYIYEEEKRSTFTLDFDDLIVTATSLLKSDYKYKRYDYIIIDEFQDTSLIRLNLIKEIYYHSKSVITAVGDDAQSIFHFTGCDLNIFLNFKEHFSNAKILFLKNTYRNSQEIIDISEKFIEKNPKQLIKNMHSDLHVKKPIEIIYYLNKINALKRLLNRIDGDDIMILARNKMDIYRFIDKEYVLQDDKLIYRNRHFKYLTIHSSKGLESTYVIIINNMDGIYGFPNKIENHKILDYITNNDNEIPYAEERRLFFVGITRCKIRTYLLVPFKNPSVFIKEIKKLL